MKDLEQKPYNELQLHNIAEILDDNSDYKSQKTHQDISADTNLISKNGSNTMKTVNLDKSSCQKSDEVSGPTALSPTLSNKNMENDEL